MWFAWSLVKQAATGDRFYKKDDSGSGPPVQGIERGNQRRTYRQSIELPIAIEAGLPAPVYGTLVNISETGCRIRSLILIDRDRDVRFELKRPGHKAISLKRKRRLALDPALRRRL